MSKTSTKRLVLTAILTALVVLLQLLGSFIKFGPFSISLVLIPIVVGAATCGVFSAAWLGFVFGFVVLMSGDAGAFLAVDIFGTIVTVLLKGTLCGLFAGLVYSWLRKFNKYIAVICSAIICPLVNTGVFLLGCLVFFMGTITGWAEAAGFGANAAQYMIFGMVGANFLFELLINIILSPIIVRLIKIKENN